MQNFEENYNNYQPPQDILVQEIIHLSQGTCNFKYIKSPYLHDNVLKEIGLQVRGREGERERWEERERKTGGERLSG